MLSDLIQCKDTLSKKSLKEGLSLTRALKIQLRIEASER